MMKNLSFPVLLTKLFIPRIREQLVERPRLFEKIDSAGGGEVVLISAPAGFGKSTLASSWVSSSSRPCAWLSLDNDDNNPERFLFYLTLALRGVYPGLEENLEVVRSGSLDKTDTSFTYYISEVINEVAAGKDTCVLVLEDYHSIHVHEIHTVLDFFIEHLPKNILLIISSRSDPPVYISKLRASGRIIEIRGLDLRFSVDETGDFLNQIMNLNLRDEDVISLEENTEGWIAGLQLAALSMEQLKDIEKRNFIAALKGSDRFILDYLLEEVLDKQDPQIREFLLHTSILNRLSGPLCDAVIEDHRSELGADFSTGSDVLHYLEKSNLFLIPLDNERTWYRYHHLFADLLRNQLAVNGQSEIATIHRRASNWYFENGYWPEAIEHLIAVEDWQAAAELLERSFLAQMSHGEDFFVMLQILESLPNDLIYARSSLCIWYAWMLSISLQLDRAETCLATLESDKGNEIQDDLRLQMRVLRAEIARHRNQLDNSIEVSEEIDDYIKTNQSESIYRSQAITGNTFNLAFAYYSKGLYTSAEQCFDTLLKITSASGSSFLHCIALRGAAMNFILGGRLDLAEEILRKELRGFQESPQEPNIPLAANALIHITLGEVLLQKNEIADAESHLDRGVAAGTREKVDGESVRDGYLSLVKIRNLKGEYEVALNLLKRAETFAPDRNVMPLFSRPIEAARVQTYINQVSGMKKAQDPETLGYIQNWIEENNLEETSIVDSLIREGEYITYARFLCTQERWEDAGVLLEMLLDGADRDKRSQTVIEIHILRACVFKHRGEELKALAALREAHAAAAGEKYVFPFIREGRATGDLLRLLEEASGENPIFTEMIHSADRQVSSPLGESLSRREQEVMELLPSQLTGPEISEKLFVSMNTLKTHMKNIYSKIGAHSRYEAVVLAKKYGLIEK